MDPAGRRRVGRREVATVMNGSVVGRVVGLSDMSDGPTDPSHARTLQVIHYSLTTRRFAPWTTSAHCARRTHLVGRSDIRPTNGAPG